MQRRIKMNSASLQEAFPEVYKDFFSKSSLVTSASGSFWFAGEYGVLYGGMGVLQKLPTRIYVGLDPTDDDHISDGGGWFFIPSKGEFEKIELTKNHDVKKKLDGLFKLEFAKIAGSDRVKSFRFFYLYELPHSCGLNSSGSLSVAFASAFLLLTDQISSKDIEEWGRLVTSELFNNISFDKVFRLSLKLESIFQEGSASGASIFAAMLSTFFPVVYFAEKRLGIKEAEGRCRLPTFADERRFDVYDKLFYRGFKMEEVLDISGDWPIDFGLIFTGDFVRSGVVIKSNNSRVQLLSKVQENIKENVNKMLKEMPDTLLHGLARNPYDIWLSYIKALNGSALETFFNLHYILKFGASSGNVDDLISSVNNNHCALKIIDVSSERMETICNGIIDAARDLGENVGCKPTGSGRKGDLLFVAPFHGLRDSIIEIIENLNQKIKEDLWVDYMSWVDGIGGEGILVEQDLGEERYSNFISPSSVQVKHLTREGKIHRDLYTYEEFEEHKNEMDVLLDAIEGDIYIKGKKLTSKDVHSARETVNILEILIGNFGKAIPNDMLPHSSYAAERGELQSKIVSPLCKAVEKNLKKKLNLHISGGVLNFTIKIEPGIDIFIIEKVF